MEPSSWALRNRVRPAGIGHEVEGFAEFNESVDQQFGSLEVNIVVAGTVDNK
jgi:hypothetical protein